MKKSPMRTKEGRGDGMEEVFTHLRRQYLIGYFFAVFADWLQAGFSYVVYTAYGYDVHDVKRFFLVGHLSSFVFGTLVGSLPDSVGRKRMVCFYFAIYMITCTAIHCNNVFVLLLGRITSGIAASLLHSAFETWLISAYRKGGVSMSFLKPTFQMATFGSLFIAIIAGNVSQRLFQYSEIIFLSGTDFAFFGPLAPFELSFISLAAGLIYVIRVWDDVSDVPSEDSNNQEEERYLEMSSFTRSRTDRYGETDMTILGPVLTDLRRGVEVILRQPTTLLVGIISASFEASLFIFVSVWSAIVLGIDADAPIGHLFSTFMVACMIGSVLFRLSTVVWPDRISLTLCFFIGAATSFISVAASSSTGYVVLMFIGFEGTVGFFLPAINILKARHVPQRYGSTIRTIFRLPMNMIVCSVLIFNIDPMVTLGISAFILFLSFSSAGILVLYEK